MRAQHPGAHGRAVGFMLASCVCFAVLDTLSKFSAQFSPVTQTLWMRYAVQVVITFVWWWRWLRPTLGAAFFQTLHPKFHLSRALLLNLSTALCFVGLRHMPLGEFTAIAFVAPIFSMLMAAWLLKESPRRIQWVFAALGFVGVLIVIRPGSDLFGWAVGFPLALALVNACFQTLTRRLAISDDHPVLGQMFVGVAGLLAFSVPLLWPGTFHWNLLAWQWLALLALGVAGTLGHFFLLRAFALDNAAALAPLSYVQIGFAMLAGWLVFSHTPDDWALVGMLVVGISGAASAWRRQPVLR